MSERRVRQPRPAAGPTEPSATADGTDYADVGDAGGNDPSAAEDNVGHAVGAPQEPAEPPSAAALRARLDELAAQREEAMAAIAQAEAFEPDNLLVVDDAALEANDATLVRLRRQAARFDKLEAITREALVDATAREAEQGRRERYQAAQALAAEADAWIRTAYAEHAAAIGAGLTRLAEIRAVVDRVNGDRPAGAPSLDAEAACKLPETPREPTTIKEVFYVDGEGDRVHVPPDGVSERVGRFFVGEHARREVFRREGRRPNPNYSNSRTYQPPSLVRTVVLPRGAHGTRDHWPPH